MRWWSAVPLALLLASCAGRTPPVPPEAAVAVPGGWRTSPGPTVPIERQWWTQFGDPVLARLVEAALAHNPDVAIAAARIRKARAQEELARSQLVPSLDLGAGTTYGRSVGPLGQATQALSAQPVFQAAYEVDLFGRVSNQVTAARQGTAASEAAPKRSASRASATPRSSSFARRRRNLRRRRRSCRRWHSASAGRKMRRAS